MTLAWTAPEKQPSRRPEFWLAGLILALGLFFRLFALGERDLWTDEAWVALAARQPDLATAFAWGKSTPPGYLALVWLSGHMLGFSEAALRLPSALFGCGTLILGWLLARHLLPLVPGLLALAFLSLSTRLVYYAKELKQYSGDAFWAVLLLLLVERLLAAQGRRGWWLFTGCLALGLGFSHPLVFFLPPVTLLLWWRLPAARRQLVRSFGLLALVFGGYYLGFFRGQVDPELLEYWQRDFPDFSGIKAFLVWLGGAWLRYLRYFYGQNGWPWGLVLLLSGLAAVRSWQRGRLAWYFFGPLLMALVAASLHRYPFMGQAGGVRLMLFSAPVLLLLTGAGLGFLLTWSWGRRRWLAVLLLLFTLGWLQPQQLWRENLWPTANREQIKTLVTYVAAHRPPVEPLYVYYFSIAPFQFYYQGPWEQIILGRSCHDTCPPLLRQPGTTRVWLLFSHFDTLEEMIGFGRKLLGPEWQEANRWLQPGAALFLYQRQGH